MAGEKRRASVVVRLVKAKAWKVLFGPGRRKALQIKRKSVYSSNGKERLGHTLNRYNHGQIFFRASGLSGPDEGHLNSNI